MKAPDLDAVAARLDSASAEAPFTHLAVIHHETTTGRLNDLKPLAEPCRARDLGLLHDGLKADGFVIYAGQGDLSKTLFRISTMGNLTRIDVDRLLTCFAKWR